MTGIGDDAILILQKEKGLEGEERELGERCMLKFRLSGRDVGVRFHVEENEGS